MLQADRCQHKWGPWTREVSRLLNTRDGVIVQAFSEARQIRGCQACGASHLAILGITKEINGG